MSPEEHLAWLTLITVTVAAEARRRTAARQSLLRAKQRGVA